MPLLVSVVAWGRHGGGAGRLDTCRLKPVNPFGYLTARRAEESARSSELPGRDERRGPDVRYDIEGCLAVVVNALRKSDLPAAEITAWCSQMLENDRVGFISSDDLQSLRTRFSN